MSVGYASASSISDWTTFRGDPGHSGAATGGNKANSAKLLWNFTTMQGVISSPAVANGCVFAGSNEGAVYCINASNGKLVWYFWTKSVVTSSPAINDGRVYIGSYNGDVYALNATNGAELWNYTISASVLSSPGRLFSSPAVVGGVVYVGSYDGNVYALNATNGAKLWSHSIGGNIESSSAVSNGTVYVASNFVLYALNASTGNELWNHHTGSTSSSPSVYNDYVYIGSYDGYVCGLNASTGAQIWKYQTQDSVLSSTAVAYGRVYVGSEDNSLYSLNASTGSKIWQSPTGFWVWSSPAVAGGNVYVGSEDNCIYCFNASSGAKQWSYPTGNFVDSSPAIANNTLYVGSEDNHIYALALTNSTTQTTFSQPTSTSAWTTIPFDAIACVLLILVVAAVLLFVRSNRRDERKTAAADISGQNRSWFSAHTDALCVLAILAFSTLFFVNLGSGHLSAADEQTYSQWAFHMVKTGDYLTPWAFGGVFFSGKPPLSIWLISLAYQVFGVNNFASRIFSAVFATLSLIVVFYLGKKIYNRTVGFLSALVLGTFTTFYMFARLAMTDVPLVFFVLGSIYFFVLSEKTEKPTRYAALSGLFFGLALMTKQIEALLILLIILTYLIATKRSIKFLFTKTFTLFWSIGLLIFSPWLIYMNASFGSQFWYWYFIYSGFTRTVGAVESHFGNYLYYFSYLANNETLLWAILLPFSAGLCIFKAVVKRVKEDTLIILWMAIVLLVFTFAQTKLFWYILPAFPAFAIAISSLLYTVSKKTYHLSKKNTFSQASFHLKPKKETSLS